MSAAKTLLLIRHAHRDTSQHSLDNGLSEKGRKQTARLVQYMKVWAPRNLKAGDTLLAESSPKRRCIETLQPVARQLNIPLVTTDLLLEQAASESFEKMQARVHTYIKSWLESPDKVRLACGHGDWLPLAVFHLIGAAVEFKKGGILEIEWESGQAHLKQYISSFKPFFEGASSGK